MKIICIGRNYLDHVAEMKSSLPDRPLFFMKPETALTKAKMPFFYPGFSQDVHYEAELVLRIGKVGKNIRKKFARNYYDAVATGLDFTARDLQQRCIREGLPWEMAKSFDGSAAVGAFVPFDQLNNPEEITFSLKKNGRVVQQGSSAQMIFGFDDLIAHVSGYVTLKTGDLLFTGTPSGVGPVVPGDLLELYLGHEKNLSVSVK